MLIYILILWIGEALGLYFELRFVKYIFLLFELFMIFFIFYFNIYYLFNKYLFLWCLFWLLFLFSFRILNYILINFEKVFEWKRKEILLRPVVNKIVYYGIWMLPWNIIYWTYFWKVENLWYFRVWVCSNRDIFFWKYFKWDCRSFFFKLNNKIFGNHEIFNYEIINYREEIWDEAGIIDNNKKIFHYNFISTYIYEIYYDLIRCFLRILLLWAFVKKGLLEVNVVVYMLNILFVFCYLSIFYLYFFENIQILNIWLMILLLLVEFIIFYFMGYIMKYLISTKNKVFTNVLNVGDGIKIQILIDPLTHEFYVPASSCFEVNNTVWNIILGDSISLNILKKYMIWVNENTGGYYYKNMNILVKKNIRKLYELSSVPFDILPTTRYVIFCLYYFIGGIEREWREYLEKCNVLYMKNLHLSFFEKTYAVKSSLLSIRFLLKLNYPANYGMLRGLYKDLIDEPVEKIIDSILMDKKIRLWRLKLAEIHMSNPELLEWFYVLNSFFDRQFYYVEDCFMYNFYFLSDMEKKIPAIKLEGSIKDYKENIKILANFLLYQEEGIVWNKEINKYINKINKEFELNRSYYNKKFLELDYPSLELRRYIYTGEEKKQFIEKIESYFEFNKEVVNHRYVFIIDLYFCEPLDLKIIKIKVNEDNSLDEQIKKLVSDLEELGNNNNLKL